MSQVTLSSKGQLVLPKAIRHRHGWVKGVALTVDDRGDEVVIRTARLFPPTAFEIPDPSSIHTGTTLTIEEMDRAVAVEAARRR